jgi:antitoxin (DNA-binding transcriptional repressor) of toxin-antitoxin stability system
MKTVTTREFFHAPSLIKSLQPGQSMVVTDKGNPAFTVTRSSKRRTKSRADLEREAAEISSDEGPKVNFTSAIAEMKRR